MEENPYENQVEFALRYGELDHIPGFKNHRRLISICVLATVFLVGVISLFWVIRSNNLIVITFDANGGTAIADMQVDKGSTITFPETYRSGYVFEGWYRNGTKVNESATYSEDTTLVARWLSEGAETYLVEFDSDGGDAVEPIRVECGKALNLPETPEREGYTFVVWSDDNDVPILDGALLSCKDVKLTATWSEGSLADNEGPESVSLDQDEVELSVGDTGLLIATVKPDNAKNKTLVWTSSDPEVITIDPSGIITARQLGEAVITVTTINGKSASATVYSDVDVVTLKASSSLEYITNYGDLDAQKSVSFSVSVFPNIPLEESDYIWESSTSSGITSAAILETEGDTATLTAKNTGGNDVVPITVRARIGRKYSEEITIYVEPQLILTGDKLIVTDNELTATASVDVAEWSVRAREGSTVMTVESISREDRKMVVKPTLLKPNIQGSNLVITAVTRAGQKANLEATCVPK